MSKENQKTEIMNKYQLKKTIKELKEKRGRNTELVSVYVPQGYDLNKISTFITSEQSEAENIKSKQTRKNVKAALDKIGRRIKEVGRTPEKGVAFFAGNVSEREGRPDIQLWEIVPPQPIESRRYRCDKEFVTKPLEEMVVNDKVYGLIVADKRDAAIGFLQGNSIKTAYTMESNVPGKTRAGGQSSQRFERIRKEMYKTFMKEISEKAKNAFLPKKRDGKLLGIVLGGPGFTKDKIIEEGYLHQELEEEIITTESTNYSGKDALEELVEKAEESIEDSEVVIEKKLVTEFFQNLKEENGKAEYGLEYVLKALEMGAVDKLLITENIDLYHAEYTCENEHSKEIYEKKPEIDDSITCDDCGREMDLEEISDIIDILAEKAEEMSSDLELISTDHEEGERLSHMTGIAAILRYRIR